MGVSVKLFFIFQLFIFIPSISGQEWFPLNVGNKWQYLVSTHNDFPEHQSYYLSNINIESDSVINNYTYYNINFYNSILRYDSLQQKIFIWCDSSEFLLMDFNLPSDTTLMLYTPECYYDDISIISSNITFNDSGFNCKGFYWFYPGLVEKDLYYYYGKGLGILKQIEFGRANGGHSWTTDSRLIQADLNGINYSENYNPEININPVQSVSDSVFHMTFAVNHEYNRVFADTNYYTNLNFIDTVKMYSFYTNGSSTIENLVIYALNNSGSENWVIDTGINLDLLMIGYKFNYRIEAIDKGLISHKGFAPDSGYFVVIFDTTTGVDNINPSDITFKIYQNYPNPFNSSTRINYSIPAKAFVKIRIMDVLGREVAKLVDIEQEAGYYIIKFDASTLSSGVYFYSLQAGNFYKTKKMILLR